MRLCVFICDIFDGLHDEVIDCEFSCDVEISKRGYDETDFAEEIEFNNVTYNREKFTKSQRRLIDMYISDKDSINEHFREAYDSGDYYN